MCDLVIIIYISYYYHVYPCLDFHIVSLDNCFSMVDLPMNNDLLTYSLIYFQDDLRYKAVKLLSGVIVTPRSLTSDT